MFNGTAAYDYNHVLVGNLTNGSEASHADQMTSLLEYLKGQKVNEKLGLEEQHVVVNKDKIEMEYQVRQSQIRCMQFHVVPHAFDGLPKNKQEEVAALIAELRQRNQHTLRARTNYR